MATSSYETETTLTPFKLEFKSSSDIYSSLVDDFLINNNELNDFTEGSIISTLYESISDEIEQLYYLTLENMEESISDSITDAFGFHRKQATYAYGDIILTYSNPTGNDMYLPKGTKFSCKDQNYPQVFETLHEYLIPKGSKRVKITVYCTELGTYGNVPANVINDGMGMTSVESITNPLAFNTGQDEETVLEEQTRFRQMIQSLARGTRQSLEYACYTVDEIQSCYIYESYYGTVVVYVADGNGNLSNELRHKVATVLANYKPAGVRVIVRAPHISYADLDIQVAVSNSLLMQQSFLTKIRDIIERYVNNYGIGQNVFVSDIIQKVMDISDTGITDCHVALSIASDTQLSDDPIISEDSKLYLAGEEVTQEQLMPPNITRPEDYGIISDKDDTNYTLNGDYSWIANLSPNLFLDSGLDQPYNNYFTFENTLGHDTISVDDTTTYEGNKSLNINLEDDGERTVVINGPRISVVPNQVYSARVFAKAFNLIGNVKLKMNFYHDAKTPTMLATHESSNTLGNDNKTFDWCPMDIINKQTPSGAKFMNISIEFSGYGQLWLSEFQINNAPSLSPYRVNLDTHGVYVPEYNNPVPVLNIYKTAPNEMIKVGRINVRWLDENSFGKTSTGGSNTNGDYITDEDDYETPDFGSNKVFEEPDTLETPYYPPQE